MSGQPVRRRSALVGALTIMVVACGCATLPVSAPPGAPARPSGSAPRGTSPPTATRPAVVDSGPTPEALAVLENIPEPLPEGERVPPPVEAPWSPISRGGVDSTGSEAADSSAEGIPVPVPTLPLGDRPRPAAADSDSVSRPPDSSGATSAAPRSMAPPPSVPPPPKAAPPRPSEKRPPGGPCWRVQIAAPVRQAEAEQKRSAAESLLLVPVVIEPEGALFKVRTRNCIDRPAAEQVRQRAVASGFEGAFLIAR